MHVASFFERCGLEASPVGLWGAHVWVILTMPPPSRRNSGARGLDLLGSRMAEMTIHDGAGAGAPVKRAGEFVCSSVYLGSSSVPDAAGSGEVG